MSLKTDIQNLIVKETKAKNDVSKNVLKVVLGEVQTQEVRNSKPLTDEQIIKILKKTLDGVCEMLVYRPYNHILMVEKDTLEKLIPKTLSASDIATHLQSCASEIVAANNDGQAVGIAMKKLKSLNVGSVDGSVVKSVIQEIRKCATSDK